MNFKSLLVDFFVKIVVFLFNLCGLVLYIIKGLVFFFIHISIYVLTNCVGFVVLILAFPFLIFKLIFEKSEDNNSSPTPTEIEKETKDEKTVNETTTTKYVGVANNNAVDEKSKQTQSSDSLSQEDEKFLTFDELLEFFEKEDNQELLEQDGLSEEDKEFLTNAKEIIGVDLGWSDNLADTIKDIDDWVNRYQIFVENDVFDKEELAVYNDILRLRQRLGNQLQTQTQDNNSVNS